MCEMMDSEYVEVLSKRSWIATIDSYREVKPPVRNGGRLEEEIYECNSNWTGLEMLIPAAMTYDTKLDDHILE